MLLSCFLKFLNIICKDTGNKSFEIIQKCSICSKKIFEFSAYFSEILNFLYEILTFYMTKGFVRVEQIKIT